MGIIEAMGAVTVLIGWIEKMVAIKKKQGEMTAEEEAAYAKFRQDRYKSDAWQPHGPLPPQ